MDFLQQSTHRAGERQKSRRWSAGRPASAACPMSSAANGQGGPAAVSFKVLQITVDRRAARRPRGPALRGFETLCYSRFVNGVASAPTCPSNSDTSPGLTTAFLTNWIYVAVFIAAGAAMVVGILLMSRLIYPIHPSAEKYSTYECGIEPVGNSWRTRAVRYHIFALLFLVFDVEAIFLFPWALT